MELSAELKDDFCELAAEGIAAKETPYINWDGDFEDYLRRMQILAKGENLPDGAVPSHTYFLFCDGKIIGRSELHRELNDELELIGGHIGADIRYSERKKGYGTLILRLTLEKARSYGLKNVLVTCDTKNTASAKTIEKCGGRLDKQVIHEETGTMVSHYRIEL
ncbi:MAG TPA: GNAT family N-acetyltransferase [Pyrinomonadaceae bacterium]